MGINDSGRKKLIIVKLLEKRKVGDAEVQEFTAKIEGEEATGKHGVWSKVLYEYIKEGITLDCHVVTKKSEKPDPDGNPYWNRKVTQIYVDDKAVATKGQGGGFQSKSIEVVREELRAKARNTALMQAVELAKVWTRLKTADDVLDVAEALDVWLNRAPKTQKTGEDTHKTIPSQPDAETKAKDTGEKHIPEPLLSKVIKLAKADEAWHKTNLILYLDKLSGTKTSSKSSGEAYFKLNKSGVADFTKAVDEAIEKLPDEVDPGDIAF